MTQDFAKPREASAAQAAQRLGLTSQAVRDRIRAGSLPGRKDSRGQWRVPEAALPTAAADAPQLDARMARLERELEALRVAHVRDVDVADGLAAERDRYRADALATREVATRLNIAVAEASSTARSLLNALDAQTEALTQLLTPGSPADLVP